jgi:hypothetical protein
LALAKGLINYTCTHNKLTWKVLKLKASMINAREQALSFTPGQSVPGTADALLLSTPKLESFHLHSLESSRDQAHFSPISLGVSCCGIISYNTLETTGQDPCCFLSRSDWFPLFSSASTSFLISPGAQCFEKCYLITKFHPSSKNNVFS